MAGPVPCGSRQASELSDEIRLTAPAVADQSDWLREATGVRFGAPREASLRFSMSLR